MASYTLSVKGSKQGDLKGETGKDKTKISILGFSFDVKIPREASSGLANGKRQYKPLTVYKEWGEISVQLFQAMVTNEHLVSVVIDELRLDPQGKEEVYMEIRLSNAFVAGIDVDPERQESQPLFVQREVEAVSFAFEKIEIENKVSKAVAVDDLGHPT